MFTADCAHYDPKAGSINRPGSGGGLRAQLRRGHRDVAFKQCRSARRLPLDSIAVMRDESVLTILSVSSRGDAYTERLP